MPKVAIAGPEDLDRVRAVIERSRKTYANLAPLWNRVGAFIFRHGEHFYNFQGLRQYKEKFDPEWKSKYLASPGGLALPNIFPDVASLVSGGLKGAFSK